MKKIPYGKQVLTKEDIEIVVATLQGELITQGPKVEEFEKIVADYHEAKYAIAFSNGTTALHAAYDALGTTTGDEIISPDMTFVASSNAGIYCGANPILVDIDLNTNNIDIEQIEASISDKTKVICAVSIAGYPVELEKISKIAKRHNLGIIHDAAHAIGSRRAGTFGIELADFTMLSFHPVKHITTGEGGMLLTNNLELAKAARLFRAHGITRERDMMETYDGGWSYDMISLGHNYRICDIQCALGLSQFKRIEQNLLQRNLLAKRYNEAFKNEEKLIIPPHFDLSEMTEETDVKNIENLNSYHLYTLRLTENVDRKELFEYLKEQNIFAQIHYIPVHWHKYYRDTYGYKREQFPNTNKYYQSEISIPMYHSLTIEEQDYVIEAILMFIHK